MTRTTFRPRARHGLTIWALMLCGLMLLHGTLSEPAAAQTPAPAPRPAVPLVPAVPPVPPFRPPRPQRPRRAACSTGWRICRNTRRA